MINPTVLQMEIVGVFIDEATECGFRTVVNKNPWVIFLRKTDVQIAIYFSKRTVAKGFTVSTTLTHPKMKRQTLYRKGLSADEVYQLIKNPRTHTGKGYRAA